MGNRAGMAWGDLEDDAKESLLKEGVEADEIFDAEYKIPLLRRGRDRWEISLDPFVKISRYK